MINKQSDVAQLRRLEPTPAFLESVVAHGGEIVTVGPFRAFLHPTRANDWANYATPVDPMDNDNETASALEWLRRLFVERERTLRFEFNEPLWPQLAPVLERSGLTLQDREPIMLLTLPEFRSFSNPDVVVRFLHATDAEADLAAFQSIFSQVLGDGTWQAEPGAIARLREEVEQANSRSHALAILGAIPVGTGYITSVEGVSELTRIATLPVARRIGVAATLTSFMLQDRFDGGDTLAWLTAEDPIAQALYVKLGFHVVGDRLYYAG